MDGSEFRISGFYEDSADQFYDNFGLDELIEEFVQDIVNESQYNPMLPIVSSGLRLTRSRWLYNNGRQLKIQFKDE